jgi:DNA-binding XRE family transcriptional regulator
MSELTKKHLTKHASGIICVLYQGKIYHFPKKVAEKYQVEESPISSRVVFAAINKKYTKPGALLKGLRVRENLTQAQMAKQIKVTQSDISQMENGSRSIGRMIARRIEKLFEVDYRAFLE